MADLITLESAELRVALVPHYGARLVNLVAKRSGREWLAQGALSPDTGEDAVYRGAEALGWDECFPTVSPCDATGTVWGRRLRDHGDVWGRPWQIDSVSATEAQLHYEAAEFVFGRTLRVAGPELHANYWATNRRGTPLPYLWALHALLAVEPADRIELPGVRTATPTYLSTHSDARAVGPLAWSGANGALPFPLDEVQPPTSNFAGKFFADGSGRTARLGQADDWLTLSWDAATPALGLWLTYGGWPEPGGHFEIAIEPTNAMADDVNEAIAAGAPPLAPGETRRWEVRLTVSS